MTKQDISIVKMEQGEVTFCILGQTPIILNRMTEKAKRELLMPAKKSGRKSSLKHDPYQEFRDSPYTIPDDNAPAYLAHLATAFKGAIRGAGVDTDGISKAELGRLLWVNGERIPLFGEPQLMMAITRSAGMNKTPDVRTRACIPKWACMLSVSFMKPKISASDVTNLLVTAGLTQGVGDWRPEKGAGNYGQFTIVDKNDEEFNRIINSDGRDVQKRAMQAPVMYDDETVELMSWFDDEAEARGFEVEK